ncbi:hypothetical protein SAMN05444008_11554 [Cnuella takakiae]|uniref:Fibronectin type-III domain-containing protein n=1 Tax=Cnuella takakiae TaxID=1302690 RepID=A0A1M5G0X6_9BACT|nr:hypothetical protein [Cnuella takakiae]OLY92288.1 hypothetical protein BUE76_10580 [Cnuella takakiae]SHF97366.1 hypothetical protein SAMN05444008_11554 [Cnuella takakiae]
MSYRILERPYKFSYAANPVLYRFDVANPEAPGCAIEIELRTVPITGTVTDTDWGVLISRQTLYPGADGVVNFYCQDYLNSYMDWHVAELASNEVVAVTTQIRKYYIRHRQIQKGNTSPAWNSDSANLLTVLKGGVAKEKWDRNNFFVSYLVANKPFLTWQPADELIGLEERRYLTYFHHYDTTPELRLKARVVYQDGATDTVTKAFPPLSASLLFHLPAGLKQLGLFGLQPGKKVWFYDVSVEDDGGNVYAKPYRLYADYRPYYNAFSFIYANSLGGIDSMRVRGDYDIEIQREYTEVEKAGGDYAGELLPTERAVINISKYEVYKGDAGMLNTPRMQEAMQDMLLSDFVLREIAGRWLRVMHMQKTQPMGGTDDTVWSFPLQWRYTFNNSQFTPLGINLGAAVEVAPPDDFSVCTPPSGLQFEYIEAVPAQLAHRYRFTWNEVLAAEGYELEVNNGSTWSAPIFAATNTALILLEIDNQYSWRVRTKCGDGDYSAYTVGPGIDIVSTAPACSAPINLETELVTIDQTTATMQFKWSQVPGVLEYVLEWRQSGSGDWQSKVVAQAAPPTTIQAGFLRDGGYEWRVRSKCNAAGDYSGYAYGETFVPSNLLGSCTPPTNLSVTIDRSTIGKARAQILGYFIPIFQWTAAQAASSYEWQLREKGTNGAWLTQNNVQSGMMGNALVNRNWEWRVRTNCTGGGFSQFINGPEFNTNV